ncbi:hypothetical protein DIJ64_00755 [Mycobacterium leprae]|uniref:PE domain-containing protein n=1 Tax=Mycobacterium leprae TaxID=1769 RepID=A0AAD0P7L1_MYCLR|nr:hypothetical protein DIJ64_00755 [Mycobacterium leprae]
MLKDLLKIRQRDVVNDTLFPAERSPLCDSAKVGQSGEVWISFLIVAPKYVASVATDLANICSAISLANTAVLAPTTGALAAGGDAVLAAVAALIVIHTQAYQALRTQVVLFHDQFVQLMSGGAGQYAATKATNTLPLQTGEQEALNVIKVPTQALFRTPADR